MDSTMLSVDLCVRLAQTNKALPANLTSLTMANMIFLGKNDRLG